MEQVLFNWIFSAIGAAFGWILKVVWDAVQELKRDMRQIERDLPEVYVRREDYKDTLKDLKDDMRLGFAKIDTALSVIQEKIDRTNE